MSMGNKNYYQGKYQCKNPNKYKGDITQIFYRSSWELKLCIWLDTNTDIIEWSSEETVIPYICSTDNRPHRYFVDFKVKTKNGDTFLVEVKPYKQTVPPTPGKRKTKRYLEEIFTWGKNESKWKAAKDYCNERGWKFIILTEKEINPVK